MTRTLRSLLSAMFVSTGLTFSTGQTAFAQDAPAASAPAIAVDEFKPVRKPAAKQEAAKKTGLF